MYSDKNFIAYLFSLVRSIAFAKGATWVLINPQEIVRKCLIEQSKIRTIANFFIYQDSQFKDQKGAVFNNLEGLNPLKTYFFIDSLSSAQESACLIPEYSFVITLNEIGESLNGIVFDENNLWEIIFMANPNTAIIGVTQNSLYRFLRTLGKETFEEIMENYSNEIDSVDENSKKAEIYDYFRFEVILPTLEIVEKKIAECGYEKKANLEEIIDLMHALLLEKHYEKNVIAFREFLIEGIIEKIKNLIVSCKSGSRIFFEELENLNAFLNQFPLSRLMFKAIQDLETSALIISFVIDYFSYSNINNLLDTKKKQFTVEVIDETNEKTIFGIINGEFTCHMMRILEKDIVMERLRKINKIALEAADKDKALKVLRQNLQTLNIQGLNESMYEIVAKHGDSFFAYPNENGLKFMIKETIPKSLLILSGEGKIVNFIGKALIGGKIALKRFSIDKIKNNMKTLSKLELANLEKEIKNELLFKEEKTKSEIEEAKNSTELKGEEILSEKTLCDEISSEGKIKIENVVEIKKNYRETSYLELNQLQMEENIDNFFFVFEGERMKMSIEKIIKDKLKIEKVTFFMVIAHEIFHSMRMKFATNLRYSNKTPEKMFYEAGLLIDQAIYGNHIRSANFNPQKMTLAIAQKVLELKDLTHEEAYTIYTSGNERKIDVRAFGCYEFEDDNENDEWLCTGRIAPITPIRI